MMNDVLTPDVLFTIRVLGIAFAAAWGVRGLRGSLKLRLNWHAWATVLAVGVVGIGGYVAWRCVP
jgi:hypothetical protein